MQAQLAENVALLRNCETMDDFRRMFSKAVGKYGDVQRRRFDWPDWPE